MRLLFRTSLEGGFEGGLPLLALTTVCTGVELIDVVDSVDDVDIGEVVW